MFRSEKLTVMNGVQTFVIEEKTSKIKKIKKYLLTLLNLVVAFIILFPIIYAVSMSVRPESDIFNPEVGLIPNAISLKGYQNVFTKTNILIYIRNSFIVSTVIMILQVFTSSLAAFSFSFMRFRGRKIIFALVLATMMIPGEVTIISQYLMVAGWGLSNTLTALILPFITTAMGIFLFVQSFEKFPKEIYESAKIDGCSDLKFYQKILMPISKPTVGALSVISFLGAWNMYMWPLLITGSDEYRTVQIGLSRLSNVDGESIVLMLAGVVICLIPSLTVFLIARKNMIKGLTSGAVKG